MPKDSSPAFETRTIDQLAIDDEASFAHVSLYGDLKEILRRDRYAFRVLPKSSHPRWDRALFLNLTFWEPGSEGDVLVEARISADVVTHVGWHHLAARANRERAAPGRGRRVPPSTEGLILGEAIASAFDVYLVGRLLGHAPKSSFLQTQVTAMAETAHAAGLRARDFESMLAGIAADPERAFEDLRELLWDATRALRRCASAWAALSALAGFDRHRFGPLLHRYEISNWLLYSAAYGRAASRTDAAARAVDRALRLERDPIAWLTRAWVEPALGADAMTRERDRASTQRRSFFVGRPAGTRY